jgi:putative flippase GtrA
MIQQKELIRFLFSGGAAVVTDFAVYYLLHPYTTYAVAKGISFVTGSIVAFLLNKYWTFGMNEYAHSEVIKFAILYTLTLGANMGVNELCLTQLHFAVWLAFLFATGTSTVLNFIGQKWWVFSRQYS